MKASVRRNQLGLQPLRQVLLSTSAALCYHPEGNFGVHWKLKWDVSYKFQICHFQKKKIPTNNYNYLPCETAGCVWKWGGSWDSHQISDLRICQAAGRGKRHSPSSSPHVSWGSCKMDSSCNSRSISLEDQAEFMHTNQCEMDLGDGEHTILLPNLLRVSTGIWTTPVLDTDHRFSRVLTPRHSEVPTDPMLLWILEKQGPHQGWLPSQLCSKASAHLWNGYALYPCQQEWVTHTPRQRLQLRFQFVCPSSNYFLLVCGWNMPPHFPVTQWETVELSWGWLPLLSP